MDILLIVLTVVFVIVLIALNIYLLALYVHTDDKGWGTAVYCKILVVLGLTVCQAQALMVPLDIANQSSLISGSKLDMASFWFFLYIIVLFLMTLALPFALFFYETDELQSFCRRLVKTILYTLAANIISIMLLFISWAFLKYVDLPVHTISVDATRQITPNQPITTYTQTETNVTLTLEASLAVYIIAIMSFIGWIFVFLFAGVGLFALPIDLINEFRHRPKARKSEDIKTSKNRLTEAIKSLLQEGETLKKKDEQQSRKESAGWFDRWKGKRQFENEMSEFRAKYFALSQEFEVFGLELKFGETNPIIPVLKLVLGIIFILTSLLWLLQILIGNIIHGLLNRPLVPFLNEMLIKLNSSNAAFIATGIFAYLCLYMLWCVQKGNTKFGLRVPCLCRFHPMKENETWMNSFLFNVIVLLIASVGVIQLCISSFQTYTVNAEIYMIFNVQLRYMRFYNLFYNYNIFSIALICVAFLGLIYLLFVCNQKPPYMKEIEKIRSRTEEENKLWYGGKKQ